MSLGATTMGSQVFCHFRTHPQALPHVNSKPSWRVEAMWVTASLPWGMRTLELEQLRTWSHWSNPMASSTWWAAGEGTK